MRKLLPFLVLTLALAGLPLVLAPAASAQQPALTSSNYDALSNRDSTGGGALDASLDVSEDVEDTTVG